MRGFSLAVEQSMYNFGAGGSTSTFDQWLTMIADEQGDDGATSDIIPNIWPLG